MGWSLLKRFVDPECNLEFQGSVQNLYKIALLAQFYPEIPQIKTIFGKKVLFCQILQGAASDYRMLISYGLFCEICSEDVKLLAETIQTFLLINLWKTKTCPK